MIVKELLAKLGLEVDESSFAAGEAALGAMEHGFLALGAVVSGAVLALAGMVKATANAGDEARKMSQRLGVDSEVLQEFGYAAELSDVSVEELAVGLQHLAKTGVKDTRGAMLDLAERFHNMPDGAAKTKLAMEKFGRAGARLIPMLNEGKEGLAEMAAEAEAFGLVLSKDVQKESEEFNDQLTRLSKVFVGFRNRMVVGLLKPLTEFTVVLRKAATAAFTWVSKAENLQFVLTLLAVGVATVTAAFVVLKGEAIVAAARVALAWLAAAAPFIALAAVVVLAALVIQDLMMYLGNDGETAIGRFIAYYKREFGSLKDFTKAVFDWLDDLVGGFFSRNIKKMHEFFKPITSAITGYSGSLDPQSLVKGYAGADAQFDANGRLISGTVIPSAPVGASNSATMGPVNITVNAPDGMNTVDLAKKVGDEIEAQWRRASGGLF